MRAWRIAEETQLRDLAERLAEAERSRNVAVVMDLLAEDYEGIGAGGEVLTRSGVLERFNNPQLIVRKHEFLSLQVRSHGTFGIIYGAVRLEGEVTGRPFAGSFRFSDVCVKNGGRWQMVFSHLTAQGGQAVGGGEPVFRADD